MPKLSWPDMIRVFPGGHLVVGYLPIGTKAVRPSRIVRRLIERQGPRGSWAISTRQEIRGPALYCLFESKHDADRFAKAVHARSMSRYPGWASQRCVNLDDSMMTSVAAALAEEGKGS